MSDYTNRKFKHDYKGVCSYHMIFRKNDSTSLFGEMRVDPHKSPKDNDYAFIYYSDLGRIIVKEVYNIHVHQPEIVVTQYKVMPDHVHLLIRVMSRLPQHVGFYMGLFMGSITRKWRLFNDADDGLSPVFKENYTDRPIYTHARYIVAKKYIKDNPYRLAMRRLHPDFFRKARNITINGKQFQAYGNLFHLRNPFMSQVVVHRVNSAQMNEELFELWREEIEKGGVLVSPFISPLEKRVRREAVDRGGRIIHVQKDVFGERFKPPGADFELCCKGQLLIIAPVESFGKDLSKMICYEMNKIAEEIVKGNFSIG